MKTSQRYKLNDQQRGWMEDMAIDVRCLREDWPRRLRNALLALAGLDPRWMIWVDQNILPSWLTPYPRDVWEVQTARMIEAHARALLLKRYGYLGCRDIGDLIFRDWPFGDDGNLREI